MNLVTDVYKQVVILTSVGAGFQTKHMEKHLGVSSRRLYEILVPLEGVAGGWCLKFEQYHFLCSFRVDNKNKHYIQL